MILMFLSVKKVPSAVKAELEYNPDKLLSKDDSALVYELANYLDWVGLSDPLMKVLINFLMIDF